MRKLLFGFMGLLLTATAHAVDISCKNLFDPAWLLAADGWTESNGVYSGVANVLYNKYKSSEGGFPLTFDPNTQYTISATFGANESDFRFVIVYNDDTTSTLPAIRNGNSRYTTPAGKTVKTLACTYGSGANIVEISKIQIERGATATTYEPYSAACATANCHGTLREYVSATGTGAQVGTPTPDTPIEPTFYHQGRMILRKVGDVADSYNATTGKITRNVGVLVLDGTKEIVLSSGMINVKHNLSNINMNSGWQRNRLCSHGVAGVANATSKLIEIDASSVWFGGGFGFTVGTFRDFLVNQYDNGTPVTIYYPLATPVEEDWTETSYCDTGIKIATKSYVNGDNGFGPSLTNLLNTVIPTITGIVSSTVTQATSIGTLATGKQTRPDPATTDGACPAGKQCLLVEGTDGDPHWYEIFDPVQWFMPAIWSTNAAFKGTQTNSNWTYYNGFYKGDSNFRKTYIDGSTSTYDRPFSSTTRCTTHNFNGETPNAEPCYNTMTGAFHTLTDGEWAAVYEGNEAAGVKPGIIYGTSKCTSVAGPNNYATAHPTKLSELTAEQQAAWEVLPTSSTKDNYKQCWCKMTSIGVNDNGTTVADLTRGGTYSVGGAAWVFSYTLSSAATCAYNCASNCAPRVRISSGFRAAVFGF